MAERDLTLFAIRVELKAIRELLQWQKDEAIKRTLADLPLRERFDAVPASWPGIDAETVSAIRRSASPDAPPEPNDLGGP